METKSEITITTAATTTVTHIITPVMGNYITHNDGFVDHLLAVREQINNYVNKRKVSRPLNILLAAPPGSGKSFLIKQLIKSIDLKDSGGDVAFEEIYIASLETASELYGIFQRVQSINLEGRLPVVFFDEVDSQVGNQYLYAKFLAPMWDGNFYIGKEKFFLGRSIFFFAGSTLSLEDESHKIVQKHSKKMNPKLDELLGYDDYFSQWKENHENWAQEVSKKENVKLTDFLDRIDAIIRIPPICKEMLGEKGLELEYLDLSIMLIKKHFPDVSNIGKIAIEKIVSVLIKSKSMRPAEKAIFGSAGGGGQDTFDLSSLPAKFRRHISSKDVLLDGGQERVVYTVEFKKSSSDS